MPPHDVIIVGGGPGGLSAAMLLSRSCRRVLVVDAGHPRNAAAVTLHGYLGRDGTRPSDLLQDGRTEISEYRVEVWNDLVVGAECVPRSDLQPFETAFRITTRDGRTPSARKLLFATGVSDELPDIPGFRECYGITIHHCPYCDGWEHRGKRIVAFGNHVEDAVGLGIALRTWSDQVTVLANAQRISAEQVDRLSQSGIALCKGKVTRIIGKKGELQAVQFDDNGDLAADALFFNTRQRANCTLPALLGCDTDDAAVAKLGNVRRRRVRACSWLATQTGTFSLQ